MIRCFGIVVVLLFRLAAAGGCTPGHGSEEALRLDQQARKLQGEGKLHEAIPLAERSLALRELALGPVHRDVATSLNNLAMLYRARGTYARAEPLLVRALDIREKLLGSTHPEVAQSLSNLGLLSLDQAVYRKAEPLLARALDIAENTQGPVHPDVAHHLNRLGELHRAREDYARAEPLLLRALDISEKALGPLHPDVAHGLHLLGELHRVRGEYADAEPLHARALDIREKVLGPMHPDVAISLNGVASLLRDKGAYQQAEPLHVRALDIAEQALGPAHPEVARSLNHLAELYRQQGSFDRAERLQARALDIAEKMLGPMHPEVAQYLSNLAVLHWIRGAYARSEPLHARALDIREKAFGPTHTEVARSLNNLAMVIQDQGAHGKAEPLYVRALDINEKTLGPSHARVASTLNNLATLYWEQGAYEKAEPLLVRAVDVAERALGPLHPDVAQSLSNLAMIHHIQGRYGKAEPLYARALQIAETALGPTHPDVAVALTNLAWLYRDQQAYERAEPLLIRALDVREKALGPAHPDGAWAMLNLAALYRDQRAYGKAEPLVLRAIDIREQALGPTHPELARGLNSLAKLYWAQGAYRKVEPILSRAAAIREEQLRVELPRLSEPRKRALMTFLQAETDSLVSLHAHAVPRSEHALDLAFTNILRRKGRILDSQVGNESALRSHLTPALRDQLDQLDRARSDLVAQLYASRAATDREAIASVRARIEELEAALSAASAELRVQSEPVTVATIQAALPPGAALVEFVRYQRFDPRRVQPLQEARYIAYVLTRHGAPQWVALGTAAAIDAKVDAVLAAMDDKLPPEAANTALQRLDAVVFAPIRARLTTSISHLILAPDGKLNLVPFEALVDPRGRHALTSYLVSYVTTGRDILRFGASSSVLPRSPAVIVAAPDYGPSSGRPGPVSFPPLANALGEAADLVRYFPAPPLTGKNATKSALKALAGPAMLHVATHGFYARNRGPRPMPAPGHPSREMFADGGSALLSPPRSDDPLDGLDRAGLAMAGANQGAAGILTAREIAGLDWWGTQLVVLSACETGVGAVPSGDGVYGLRRALLLAGTASQVVSLWNVDDASTRELMRDYYTELARGIGRAEALRRAKLRLMHQSRHVHPHFWAAFIPAGDWRPLDRNTIAQPRRIP